MPSVVETAMLRLVNTSNGSPTAFAVRFASGTCSTPSTRAETVTPLTSSSARRMLRPTMARAPSE